MLYRYPIVTATFVILGTAFASTHLAAQWLKYPTAGVPRKADGKVDMAAATPRMADGKPDFSGIWITAEPNRGPGGSASTANEDRPADAGAIAGSRQMRDIGVDLPGG